MVWVFRPDHLKCSRDHTQQAKGDGVAKGISGEHWPLQTMRWSLCQVKLIQICKGSGGLSKYVYTLELMQNATYISVTILVAPFSNMAQNLHHMPKSKIMNHKPWLKSQKQHGEGQALGHHTASISSPPTYSSWVISLILLVLHSNCIRKNLQPRSLS